ncbi:adhesin [Brevibacillus sp. SYP-B805]|uniref:IucA/IucC family protein n=1 Tax=Brevibacillus sp. SYP-B805 TaxID=1578199 RepID=UPI0013EE1B20|nr:IucA/IucC family protein [Brevibacillus sp. SYP-B805]NGQ96909.1 adhesin [Brevibacillus sp. SYP-B805]
MTLFSFATPENAAVENIRLQAAERAIADFLRSQVPELYDAFLLAIPTGREGILQRLWLSILRENIMNLGRSAVSLRRCGESWKPDPAHAQPDRQRVHEVFALFRPLAHHFAHVNRVLVLGFPKQRCDVIVPIQQSYAFGRFQVAGPYHVMHPNGTFHPLEHPMDVLTLLENESINDEQAPHFRMFAEDVCNSAANLSLAHAYRSMLQAHYSTFRPDTNLFVLAAALRDRFYARTEQWVIEGHPCHPGAKMRKGFSAQETFRYASEFQREIPLSFILVHRRLASVAARDAHFDWNAEMFKHEPHLSETASFLLEQRGKNRDDFILLPVHPWQLEHIVPRLYLAEIQSGDLIPVPDCDSPYYAGMSLRTLMPAKEPANKPHFKLSLQVDLTGEVRTLSEQTIHNGPLMSRILQTIAREDAAFPAERFILMQEVAGAHFLHPQDQGSKQTERSENLACVIRENVYRYVNEDEIPMVASALLAKPYWLNKPVIVELLERYRGAYHAGKSVQDSAKSFFCEYAALAVDGFIRLLVKYGIGLEGHLQNCIPVFNTDGKPVKLLVRDWEGIRVYRQRLQNAGFDPTSFHPKSRILVDDLDSARNKMFYSVVQNHLGELIVILVQWTGIVEEELWEVVRNAVKNVFDLLEQDPAVRQEAREDRAFFFQEHADYKSIMWMRMIGEAHQYMYAKVPNPLAE